MTQPPTEQPSGDVDPGDVDQVRAVLAETLRLMGVDGVVDLLARLPGVVVHAGRPKGFLSRAVPASVWVGPEDQVVLSTPPEHAQVVGGVVLHRVPLPPGQLPTVVARLVVALVRTQGSAAETSLTLTAAREAVSGL